MKNTLPHPSPHSNERSVHLPQTDTQTNSHSIEQLSNPSSDALSLSSQKQKRLSQAPSVHARTSSIASAAGVSGAAVAGQDRLDPDYSSPNLPFSPYSPPNLLSLRFNNESESEHDSEEEDSDRTEGEMRHSIPKAIARPKLVAKRTSMFGELTHYHTKPTLLPFLCPCLEFVGIWIDWGTKKKIADRLGMRDSMPTCRLGGAMRS